ncbi:MAG: hypothetical protein Q4G50_13335, partial [Corynebacterium sp.]|uniref:hypothetical protein n=1 Tax=Corynebacterium sp. TaxID=1720 RepID=UPI0026DF801E
MRKFRNATIAAATAVALTLSGTAVASAEDNNFSLSSNSSQLGKKQGAWAEGEDGKPVVDIEHQVTGQDLLGKETYGDNPEWAENWKTITTIGAIGA